MRRFNSGKLRRQLRGLLFASGDEVAGGVATQLQDEFGVIAQHAALQFQPSGPRASKTAAPVTSKRLYFVSRNDRSAIGTESLNRAVAGLLQDDKLMVRLNAAIALGQQDRTLACGGKLLVQALLEGVRSGDQATSIWSIVVFTALRPLDEHRLDFESACRELPGATFLGSRGSEAQWEFNTG